MTAERNPEADGKDERVQTRRYRCPTCKKTVELPIDAKHRPFCSARCKLVDLGRWLDEEYRISRPLGPDDHE